MLRNHVVMIACGVLLLCLISGEPSYPTSGDSFADGYNLPGTGYTQRLDVWRLFQSEAAHIRAQAFPLQPVTVDIADPLGWLERTVTCEPSCGSRLLLLRSWYWTEEQARFTIAYGISRILAHDLGLEQDTPSDNSAPSDRGILFASCFGTEMARAYADRFYKPQGDCEALAAQLGRMPAALR